MASLQAELAVSRAKALEQDGVVARTEAEVERYMLAVCRVVFFGNGNGSVYACFVFFLSLLYNACIWLVGWMDVWMDG